MKLWKLILPSAILSFIVGILGNIYASYYYDALQKEQYHTTLLLTLFILLVFSSSLAAALFVRLHATIQETNLQSFSFRSGNEKMTFDDLVTETRQKFKFLGIIAKRSVNSDSFISFLEKHRNSTLELQFLLLDPSSAAFEQRAKDERESADSWRADLEATISRLHHYAAEYRVNIQIRLYDVYPVWRLMIKDDSVVVANMFLPLKRGTQSSQIVSKVPDSEIGQCFLCQFDTMWARGTQIA